MLLLTMIRSSPCIFACVLASELVHLLAAPLLLQAMRRWLSWPGMRWKSCSSSLRRLETHVWHAKRLSMEER
jgi:hypothetical protein